jgi:hypothetical protein
MNKFLQYWVDAWKLIQLETNIDLMQYIHLLGILVEKIFYFLPSLGVFGILRIILTKKVEKPTENVIKNWFNKLLKIGYAQLLRI